MALGEYVIQVIIICVVVFVQKRVLYTKESTFSKKEENAVNFKSILLFSNYYKGTWQPSPTESYSARIAKGHLYNPKYEDEVRRIEKMEAEIFCIAQIGWHQII